MGHDNTLVRIPAGYRKVGRYVLVDNNYIPQGLAYAARTIVSLNADNLMKWYKHRDRENSALLTEIEQKELMLQILQSEKW